MAERDGYLTDLVTVSPGLFANGTEKGRFVTKDGVEAAFLSSGVTLTLYFKMRGLDVDCLPTVTYRTWVVQDAPDPTATEYAGPKCGANPLVDVVIAEQWVV